MFGNIVWWVFFLTVLFIIGYIVIERLYSHPLRLSAKEASELIKKGEINRIVDVRTEFEWNRGHFPDAIHLPLNKLHETHVRTLLDQSDYILVYCNSGTRARQASIKLQQMGYPHVYYIAETYHEL